MTPVTEVPQQFQTSDGRKFTEKDAAERHQRLVDALAAHEKAHDALGHAIAQSQRTADGEPFRFGRGYHRIQSRYGQLSRLDEVRFYYDVRFGISERRDDVELHVDKYEGGGAYRRITYRVSELYADRHAAEAALIEEQAKELRWVLEEAPKAAERLGIQLPPVAP